MLFPQAGISQPCYLVSLAANMLAAARGAWDVVPVVLMCGMSATWAMMAVLAHGIKNGIKYGIGRLLADDHSMQAHHQGQMKIWSLFHEHLFRGLK